MWWNIVQLIFIHKCSSTNIDQCTSVNVQKLIKSFQITTKNMLYQNMSVSVHNLNVAWYMTYQTWKVQYAIQWELTDLLTSCKTMTGTSIIPFLWEVQTNNASNPSILKWKGKTKTTGIRNSLLIINHATVPLNYI